MGATDTVGRLAVGLQLAGPAEIVFQPSVDTVNAGVLFSLPALLSAGLLTYSEPLFKLPNSYYRLNSLLLLLSFMALSRQKSIESLRYCAPGEWGKVLGLDRVPEVRTLREKCSNCGRREARPVECRTM